MAQATIQATWGFDTKGMYKEGNTECYNILNNITNITTSTGTWEGSHRTVAGITVTNVGIFKHTWSYGSGNINRPTSQSCIMCIRY